MEEDILKKVIAFYGQYTQAIIDKKTEINNDLKLAGDDVDPMLDHFSDRFNVNFENSNLSEYFLPELLWEYWYYRWFKPEKLKRPPLTIEHMAKVVKKGYWFEP